MQVCKLLIAPNAGFHLQHLIVIIAYRDKNFTVYRCQASYSLE